MKSKICILVEWYNHLEESDYWRTTSELFSDVKKAFDFAKGVKVRRIGLVIADNTYFDDGELNYEDKSNTIREEIVSINY